MRTLLAAGLAIAALSAGSASAAVMVLGDGPAKACYEAARDDRSDLEALRDCNAALEGALSRHDRMATSINRGIVYVNRRQAESALHDFDDAIRLNPNSGEAFVNRGAALLLAGDYTGAIASIDRGIALETGEIHKAYFNRAIAHEEMGDLRAAYEDYQTAATLSPEWSVPRAELARFTVRRASDN